MPQVKNTRWKYAFDFHFEIILDVRKPLDLLGDIFQHFHRKHLSSANGTATNLAQRSFAVSLLFQRPVSPTGANTDSMKDSSVFTVATVIY